MSNSVCVQDFLLLWWIVCFNVSLLFTRSINTTDQTLCRVISKHDKGPCLLSSRDKSNSMRAQGPEWFISGTSWNNPTYSSSWQPDFAHLPPDYNMHITPLQKSGIKLYFQKCRRVDLTVHVPPCEHGYTSVAPSLMWRITAPWLVIMRDSSLERDLSLRCCICPLLWRGKLCLTRIPLSFGGTSGQDTKYVIKFWKRI